MKYKYDKKTTKIKKKISLNTSVLLGASLIIISFFSLYPMHPKKTEAANNPTVKSTTHPTVYTNAPLTDGPDETKIDINSNYKVAADKPRKITAKNNLIQGFIQQVGLKNEQVDVPTNINVAGWYNQSEAVGSVGLSIIDGHVSGKYSDGVFKNLKKLRVGDTIEIEMGDHSIKTFSVKSVTQVPEDKASAKLFEKDPTIKSQLNIITCGGTFDRASQTYADRIIVKASLN